MLYSGAHWQISNLMRLVLFLVRVSNTSNMADLSHNIVMGCHSCDICRLSQSQELLTMAPTSLVFPLKTRFTQWMTPSSEEAFSG